MAGERRALQDALVIDLSHLPVPPLRFMVQPSGPQPPGLLERLDNGVTAAHTPWHTELRLDVTGADAVMLLYRLPLDDDTMLQLACLDGAFEPVYRLATGGDYGDPVTQLVAEHWPAVHAMLVNGKRKAPGRRWLLCVRTPGREQWVVADQLQGAEREVLDHDQARALIGSALDTLHKALNVYLELPGVVQVMGVPDQLSRRMSAVAGVANALGGIGGDLSEGLEDSELISLVENLHDLYTSARRLRT